jgi:hypothetical protein
MLTNYENYENYDYIIRCRLDTEFLSDVANEIEIMNYNTNVHLVGAWDAFAIGRPEIMKRYCCLVADGKYGTYDYLHKEREISNTLIGKHRYHTAKLDPLSWYYSPEMQLFEMLFQYFDENNYDINDAVRGCSYIIRILRPDGGMKYFSGTSI